MVSKRNTIVRATDRAQAIESVSLQDSSQGDDLRDFQTCFKFAAAPRGRVSLSLARLSIFALLIVFTHCIQYSTF
jgi:hypothetical protein